MITVNAMGEACPIPVVKTLQAIKEMTSPDTVCVLVDNETAVRNLKKLAAQKQAASSDEKLGEKHYRVLIHITQQNLGGNAFSAPTADITAADCEDCSSSSLSRKTLIVISSSEMGSGDPALGSLLLKGFLFALTKQETLPSAILFYNNGAFMSCEGSPALEDLQYLADEGVEILTCGTCLQHYHLDGKLKVGEVTNMYSIVEKMSAADLIIKP